MRFVYFVDRINTLIGKTVSWAIVVLTFAVCYEVFARYVLRAPTEWAFDASYMLYGLLFMAAGPYTLARNNHVRGDFIYRNWLPRRQAAMDLVLYFLFFFPGILALVYAGIPFMQMSWLMNEHSMNSPNGPPIYPFKALIPIVGSLMALQGLAEVIRCITCLRDGAWPPRLHDVEETEKLILERAEQEGLKKGTV
ncbi:TRAP transporter small permease subunit [Microvirga sp. G4-2]|uniref:TRAP transporter small permease subunit n=1 Tax=Microvirga sp. G4-2 TaxID=3434467 RepID=UPI004043FC1F